MKISIPELGLKRRAWPTPQTTRKKSKLVIHHSQEELPSPIKYNIAKPPEIQSSDDESNDEFLLNLKSHLRKKNSTIKNLQKRLLVLESELAVEKKRVEYYKKINHLKV